MDGWMNECTGIGRLNGKNWPNSASLPISLLLYGQFTNSSLIIIRELLVNWPNSANFCHSQTADSCDEWMDGCVCVGGGEGVDRWTGGWMG